MNKYTVWVSIVLQVLIILGGILAYIFTLPSKSYIDSKIDSLERGFDSKIESIRGDIKELQDDVDQLNQNYIDHLTYHVKDKP